MVCLSCELSARALHCPALFVPNGKRESRLSGGGERGTELGISFTPDNTMDSGQWVGG